MSVEDKRQLLAGLVNPGSQKLISYLPMQTIVEFMQMEMVEIEDQAKSQNRAVISFDAEHCCIHSGAAYVYDQAGLDDLLRLNSDLLASMGWAQDAEAFVRRIAHEWLEAKHPMIPVIRLAFGDGTSP